MRGEPAIAFARGAPGGTRWAVAEAWGRICWRGDGGKRRPYLDFRPLGRVYSTPGGRPFASEAEARALLESIRADFRAGKHSREAVLADYCRRTSPRLTVRHKYQAWLDVMGERAERGEIAQSYFRELDRYGKRGGYLEPIADRRVDRVTAGDFEDVDTALARRGLAPKTRWHVQRALQAFFRWLLRREDVERVPLPARVTVPEHEPTIISRAEQRAVLDAIPVAIRGAFLAMAHHGLRPGECCRLDVADYDAATGVLWLPGRKAKTKRRAGIPFGAELRAWVAEHVDPRGRLERAPLFVNPRSRQPGHRWTLDALELRWERACREICVVVGLYAGTKHSTATAALRDGVPLAKIRDALRHADVRSTEKYARAAELAPVEVLECQADSMTTRSSNQT